MCEPVSIAIATAALSAASTIMTGVGQAQQAGARQRIAEANREQAIREGLREEVRVREEGRHALARQAVQFAKAGVRLDEGTPLEVAAADAARAERNALNVRRRARVQAENFRMQAEAAAAERTSALLSAGLGAASDLLGGAQQLSSLGAFGGGGSAAPKLSHGAGSTAFAFTG